MSNSNNIDIATINPPTLTEPAKGIDTTDVLSAEEIQKVRDECREHAEMIEIDILQNKPPSVPLRSGHKLGIVSFANSRELIDYRRDPYAYLSFLNLDKESDAFKLLLTKIEKLMNVWVRFEGSFLTEDQLKTHVDGLQKTEPCFDWYRSELQQWYHVPHRELEANSDYFRETEMTYDDSRLNEIMRNKYEDHAALEELNRKRKDALIRESQQRVKEAKEKQQKDGDTGEATGNDTIVSDDES